MRIATRDEFIVRVVEYAHGVLRRRVKGMEFEDIKSIVILRILKNTDYLYAKDDKDWRPIIANLCYWEINRYLESHYKKEDKEKPIEDIQEQKLVYSSKDDFDLIEYFESFLPLFEFREDILHAIMTGDPYYGCTTTQQKRSRYHRLKKIAADPIISETFDIKL